MAVGFSILQSSKSLLLDQLSRLRERLNQQSKRVQQDATEKTQEASNYLKELSIERLNVIESDGTLRLVLCNTQHSPGHVMDGERFGEPEGKRSAGVYFFDNEGNECGGLIYGGDFAASMAVPITLGHHPGHG